MKKYQYLSILLLFTLHISKGQNCNNKIIYPLTERDNFNFERVGTVQVPFYYDGYFHIGNIDAEVRKIKNPFNWTGNPNIKDLYDNGLGINKQPDNLKKDGWRLVAFHAFFGVLHQQTYQD